MDSLGTMNTMNAVSRPPADAPVFRALVVDDETALAEVVASYLVREQFATHIAHTGPDALALARTVDPDVVVLDLGLPGIDGLEVCRQLRTFSDAYVVILTARDTEMDTVLGLTVGADDYVTKPFSPRELVARIRAMLRRPRAPGSPVPSSPPVPGKFYWMSDTQVRWRPIDFWPAGTVVNIDAAGTKSSFRVGDALVATIDDKTHQMEVVRNGKLEKTFPISLGKPGYETPNGTYYVLEKFADIVMDSSTYGVPVNSPEGYKLKVQNAVRIDNSGIFVHSAPWSVADQGKRNVSHGCPNLSPANAQWFFDNFGSGDPVVVKNSVGLYDQPDGAQDWQI